MPTTRSLAAAAGGLPAADPGWPSTRRLRGSNRNRSEAADNPERPRNGAAAADTTTETDPGLDNTGIVNNPVPAIQGPPYEVWMGIHSCGVEDIAEAKIVSKNLFMDNFSRCLQTTKPDIKDALKTLDKRELQPVHVSPYTKQMVFAFHYWAKKCFWMDIDPRSTPFPAEEAFAILNQADKHKRFVQDASDNKSTAKPGLFTKDDNWEDWSQSFEQYLSLLPGETGLPLSYVIWQEESPTMDPEANDNENFISMARLSGNTFESDSQRVHVSLIPFLAKHNEALSIVKGIGVDNRCGRKDWLALAQHYKGSGMFLNEVVEAERTIKDLYYNGENHPHMYWNKFKRLLNDAYSVFRKR